MKKLISLPLALLSASVFAKTDTEVVRRQIKQNLNQVQLCYNAVLTQDKKLSGKVVISFDVNDTGSTQDVLIDAKKSTLHHEKFETCVIEAVKTWRFPPPPKGEKLHILYPLVFAPTHNKKGK